MGGPQPSAILPSLQLLNRNYSRSFCFRVFLLTLFSRIQPMDAHQEIFTIGKDRRVEIITVGFQVPHEESLMLNLILPCGSPPAKRSKKKLDEELRSYKADGMHLSLHDDTLEREFSIPIELGTSEPLITTCYLKHGATLGKYNCTLQLTYSFRASQCNLQSFNISTLEKEASAKFKAKRKRITENQDQMIMPEKLMMHFDAIFCDISRPFPNCADLPILLPGTPPNFLDNQQEISRSNSTSDFLPPRSALFDCEELQDRDCAEDDQCPLLSFLSEALESDTLLANSPFTFLESPLDDLTIDLESNDTESPFEGPWAELYYNLTFFQP